MKRSCATPTSKMESHIGYVSMLYRIDFRVAKKKNKKSYPVKCEHSLRIHLAATTFPGHCQVVPNLAMINCPWFCMASYSFRSSSDSSTSWMTTVRGGSLTSGLPSSSSDFSRLMEICLRSFCKRLWVKEKKHFIWVLMYLALLVETGPPFYVVIRAMRRATRLPISQLF